MKKLLLSLSICISLAAHSQPTFTQSEFENALKSVAEAAVAHWDNPAADSTTKLNKAYLDIKALGINTEKKYTDAMVYFYGSDWQNRLPTQQLYAGCSLMCVASSLQGCAVQHPFYGDATSYKNCLKYWRECMRLTCNWFLVIEQLGL